MSGPRSLLIMPANREDMLVKAPTYGADALIFDLEDSVPVAEKPAARTLARRFIEQYRTTASVYVRVNGIETGLLAEDLDAVVTDGLAGIRLPKTESAQAVRFADEEISRLETARGLTPGSISISPSLESAKGVWMAYEIASASPRVRSLVAGTAENGDLQTDLGYVWTAEGQEVIYVRSRILLAARAAGIEHLVDGAYSNVRDPEGLAVCCEAARRLGYRGKSVIHPNQIETVNRAFMPSAAEIDYYRRVIAQFEQAVERGSAAITVDGKLVDYAMAGMARRVLAWADGLCPDGDFK